MFFNHVIRLLTNQFDSRLFTREGIDEGRDRDLVMGSRGMRGELEIRNGQDYRWLRRCRRVEGVWSVGFMGNEQRDSR